MQKHSQVSRDHSDVVLVFAENFGINGMKLPATIRRVGEATKVPVNLGQTLESKRRPPVRAVKTLSFFECLFPGKLGILQPFLLLCFFGLGS